MKILNVVTAYPPSIGGAQIHFHEIIKRLQERNEMQVICQWSENRTDWLLGTTLRAPAQKKYVIDNVPVNQINPTWPERMLGCPFVATYYIFKGLAINVLGGILKKKIEKIISEFKPDIIHAGRIGREPLSFASLSIARALKIPFVFTPYHHPRWIGWNYRQYHEIYRAADAVCVLTESERELLVNLGVQRERLHVIGMGPILASNYDANKFRKQHDLKGPMVLFLGQKYAYKGVAEILQAADIVHKSCPDIHFVFVGPRTSYSTRLFARRRRPYVLELGLVDIEEKTSALAACDIFCMPSTQESFGGVYVEAWSFKKPVIGANIPAVRELITEGKDGFCVAQDPKAIAAKIIKLLDDKTLRNRLGEAGFKKVQERFTWEQIVRKVEKVYKQRLS